jgi:hypothetical protein
VSEDGGREGREGEGGGGEGGKGGREGGLLQEGMRSSTFY